MYLCLYTSNKFFIEADTDEILENFDERIFSIQNIPHLSNNLCFTLDKGLKEVFDCRTVTTETSGLNEVVDNIAISQEYADILQIVNN